MTADAVADSKWAVIYEKTLDCVHCGLCLTSCPTYLETGLENSSPRGRIHLLRGIAEGRATLGAVAAFQAYQCLGCLACETACPSGVEYGAILDLTRAEVERARLRRGPAKWLEAVGMKVVAHAPSLHFSVACLGMIQRAARILGVQHWYLPALPVSLRNAWATLPAISSLRERAALPDHLPAEGGRRGCVGFLAGCVMPEFFPDVNRATVRVLTRNGFEVRVPRAQGCCGALHAHSGDEARARQLLQRNIAAFEGVDTVVVNSAGCGAAMRSAGQWSPGDGDAFAAKVRDVAEFLDEVGFVTPLRRIDATVCYDDPCHLIHGQRVADAPRRLLQKIPGLTLLAHDEPAGCCGAAGVYNLTHPEMSSAVLERKLDALESANPDIIATGNPGCLLQIRSGVEQRGMRARVVHPISLLDEAHESGSDPHS